MKRFAATIVTCMLFLGVMTAGVAPTAMAAPVVRPLVTSCIDTYVAQAGPGYKVFSGTGVTEIQGWQQVMRDLHSHIICGTRTKSVWYTGSSGYNGSSNHEYMWICYTNGSGCPGGSTGFVLYSTNIAANSNATFYSNWDTSGSCGPYGAFAVHTYGNPSGLDYESTPVSCSSIV